MTKIICNYVDTEDPLIQCEFRGEDGICTLEEIEMGSADAGWWACCENKHAIDGWSYPHHSSARKVIK